MLSTTIGSPLHAIRLPYRDWTMDQWSKTVPYDHARYIDPQQNAT
jgi:hypothetical protein